MRYIIIVLLFFSCHEEKMILHKWDTYVIKKGNHYSSGIHVAPVTSNTFEFKAVFNESAIYQIGANQTDINKLLGFSERDLQHQENSARFGWNWTDSLNIYAYCYSKGVAKNKYITSISLNKVYNYKIQKLHNRYIFYLAGKTVEMERNPKDGGGYLLFPYFGGDSPAPHNVTIKLLI
jgi:hypothetical protein